MGKDELVSGTGIVRTAIEIRQEHGSPAEDFKHVIGAPTIGIGEHPFIEPYNNEVPRKYDVGLFCHDED
jgi:hypothetical protein